MPLMFIVFLLLTLLWLFGILALEWLNIRHAAWHANPRQPMEQDRALLEKTLAYTQAKSRLIQWETAYVALLLILGVTTKALPWLYERVVQVFGVSLWVDALYLFGLAVLSSVLTLPFDWYRQFRLEERFGFNTSTQAVWWGDRIKYLVLSLILFYPLLMLVLYLVQVVGENWWIWAWLFILSFQLLLFYLAPIVILPWFNRFTPLEDSTLRDLIQNLAGKAGMELKAIEVMDGSKRTAHANAFFTGMGRHKKIALYDTLLGQMEPIEIGAVLAHEIGHYKRRHIPKMIALHSLVLLIELYLVSLFIGQVWLIEPFGFAHDRIALYLLVIGLFGFLIGFWLSPWANWLSRKFEYEADAYSAELVGDAQPMVQALQKLQTANLSNPFPHPLYSFFHYSHPTVQERVKALRKELAVPGQGQGCVYP